MPDMPGPVSRPKFIRLHDDYLNASTENRRQLGLGLLSGDPIASVYRKLGVGSPADWKHLEREFYAEEGALAYWPANRYGYLGNKQEILRQGILETLRLAEGLPESKMTRARFNKAGTAGEVKRRLETWWVCAHDRFEVNVLDGDSQVTMMILTPAMPALSERRKVKMERAGFIWTIGHKDVLSGYVGQYRKDTRRTPSLKHPYKTAKASRQSADLRRVNKLSE